MWRVEYFEIMAQIGPVLVIAYLLEERLQARGGRRSSRASRNERRVLGAAQLLGLFFTLAAEAVSLTVVAGVVRPSSGMGMTVGGLMLIGAAYVPLGLAAAASSRREAAGGMVLSLVLAVPAAVLIGVPILTS